MPSSKYFPGLQLYEEPESMYPPEYQQQLQYTPPRHHRRPRPMNPQQLERLQAQQYYGQQHGLPQEIEYLPEPYVDRRKEGPCVVYVQPPEHMQAGTDFQKPFIFQCETMSDEVLKATIIVKIVKADTNLQLPGCMAATARFQLRGFDEDAEIPRFLCRPSLSIRGYKPRKDVTEVQIVATVTYKNGKKEKVKSEIIKVHRELPEELTVAPKWTQEEIDYERYYNNLS
ncbi:hypothetical protein F5Y17DRAFT_451254 [Xylariaceae sp. FL0594]|nr:hypothetical protein F5Y17DRAFT_451254 [Xylariaceae sp. FL0594]